VVLEDARIDSTVDLLASQMEAERLRKSRLEAELAMRPTWTPPPLPPTAGERVREALGRERAAFEARQRALQGQIESARSQLADTDAEIKAYDREHRAALEALRLQREELAANQALVGEAFVNRVRIVSLQRAVAEYESRVEINRAERAKAVQKHTELQGRMSTARDAYLRTAAEDLREVTARVVDLEERLRAARDAATRQVVVAPVAGRLVDLKVNTVGSAVGPREPIVDIVPANVPLVVEVRVGADAVGDVRVGQPAEVSLLSYRKREIGMLQATVTRVSADALVEPRSGAVYFAVQAEVSPAELARVGQVVLLPGMAAEVYIKTAERSALEFLMDPLTAAMRRSFREH
jgi:HlyD family type I secretion membrane fusion protein